MSLNDFMKNLNYKIKAKEIGEASWGTRQKYKPMVMPSVDTLLSSGTQLNKQQNLRNEMVQKYIKEQDQPVQVTIDGEVRDFKFHQVEKPNLISPDDIEAQFQEYEQRKNAFEYEKQAIRDRFRRGIHGLEQGIQDGRDRLDAIEQRKAQIIQEMNAIQQSGDGSRFGEWNALRRLYVDLDTDETNYVERQILDLDFDLADVKNELERELRAVDGELEDNEEYKARIQNNIKHNKDEIKAYEQELLALNVGKLNTKQEPMESDEEYFERLTRLADMPYADGSTQEKAEIEQKQELRDNLMAITRNQELINQVVNGLYADGSMTIFELNKVFPIFKERFLKVYGVNNKNIHPEDIINFAQKIIDRPEVGQQKPQVEGEYQIISNTYTADEHNIDQEEDETADDVLLVIDEDGNDNFFKYIEGSITGNVDGKRISKLNPLFYSNTTNEIGSYVNINLPSTLKEILKKLGAGALRSLGINTNTTRPEFIRMMMELGVEETPITPFYLGEVLEGVKEKHIFGVGVNRKVDMNNDPKDIPNKIHFGDNVINLKRLFLKNILSLTTPKGAQIFGIKNTPVSDNFVKVIFDIVNGKDLLSKDLGSLNSNEKIFLETILTASGLHKKHNTGGKTQSIDKVKHDYKIIIGEIESGNNGSEIKKRLNETLLTLSHLGAISNGQARKQYKDIVSNYF